MLALAAQAHRQRRLGAAIVDRLQPVTSKVDYLLDAAVHPVSRRKNKAPTSPSNPVRQSISAQKGRRSPARCTPGQGIAIIGDCSIAITTNNQIRRASHRS